MTITIRSLKRRSGGRESVRERDFDKDELTIGRDAGSDIAITDLAIALKHAKLKRGQDGLPVLELLGRHSAVVNGRIVTGRAAALKVGCVIKLGRFELRIEEPKAPGNITATLEQVEAVETIVSADDEKAVFGLGRALPPKRFMAWASVFAILGFFLIFPIHAAKHPNSKLVKAIPIQADLAWNSGPISLMHGNLKSDCKSCHTDAFVAVQDTACTDCHKELRDHAKGDDMDAVRPQAVGFDEKLNTVSEFFGRPTERCTSCHVEHNGSIDITPMGQDMCADCHADLTASLPGTALQNVSDFGDNHPEFRPSIITAPDFSDPHFTRVSLNDNPKGFSGLKFPHKLHLSKGNAVANMAAKLGSGYGFADGVDCADCHRPEAGGALFDPVSMTKDCAMCHDLGFEDDAGYLRTLRHGEPEEVIATMRDFYLAKALANIRDAEMNSTTRRRPGSRSRLRDLNRRELAFKQADNRTAAKVKAIFTKGGACFGCHEIDSPSEEGGLDYRIRPISLNSQFYFKSPFNHASHETGDLNCASCHSAETSSFSSDIMLPKIAVCRECHVGEESYKHGGKMSEGTLPTTCLTCHSYHDGPHADIMAAEP